MTQALNLSQFANKLNTSGQADLTTGVTNTLPVGNGGTGQTTYTDGQLLIGNTTGNTLTKATLTAGSGVTITNGSGSITIAASGSSGQIQTDIFTGPGTWTKPATTTQVRVTVVSGGAGSVLGPNTLKGRPGGYAYAMVPVSAPVSVTVGAGGVGGTAPAGPVATSGGTSSFGSFVSVTGGAAPATPTSTCGTVTYSGATAIKTVSNVIPSSNSSILNYGSATQYDGGVFASLSGAAQSATGVNATAYSTTSFVIAGGGGLSAGPTAVPGNGGIGGVVIVEYIA